MPQKMLRLLPPVKNKPTDFDDIENHISELFRRGLYQPLVELLGADDTVLNTIDVVLGAIHSGAITFHRGLFTGKFNASISRELKKMGATWDARARGWRIGSSKLPPEVNAAILSSTDKFARMVDRLDEHLSLLSPEKIAQRFSAGDLFDTAIYRVESDIRRTLKNITVMPELTATQRRRVADEYSNNMRLPIRGWLSDEIKELRAAVQTSAMTGMRYESLVKMIRDSYGVSRRKAKFLARQETNLLLTKFKEVRYDDAGITHYKWQSVTGTPRHPVRLRHKALNDASQKRGVLYSFKNPPVVSEPGQKIRRANAGADYNCRCVSRPVVRF